MAAHRRRARWIGQGSLLSEAGAAREPDRILGGPEERFGLVDAFQLLRCRIGVMDDSGASLHEHPAVLYDCRAKDDAGVHFAIGAEIADASGIRAPFVLLELVDDLHRAD